MRQENEKNVVKIVCSSAHTTSYHSLNQPGKIMSVVDAAIFFMDFMCHDWARESLIAVRFLSHVYVGTLASFLILFLLSYMQWRNLNRCRKWCKINKVKDRGRRTKRMAYNNIKDKLFHYPSLTLNNHMVYITLAVAILPPLICHVISQIMSCRLAAW